MTDETAAARQIAAIREFPPLLNIEHQELIREVERAKILITANRELFESQITGLSDKLNERYAMQTDALKAALESAEKAVEKANTASEKRFDGVNEFRGQLSDIIGTMMPRAESMALVKGLDEKVADLKSTLDKLSAGAAASQDATRWTKGDNRGTIGMYVAVGGLLLTIIAMVLMNTARTAGH